MPFIEEATSQADLSYDADGYAHVSRTFKVWDVSRLAFFADPSVIPPHNTGTGSMPKHGDVLMTVNGPSGPGYDTPTTTNLTLYHYRLQPISALVFRAIGLYSNDPRLSPLGQGYASNQQTSIVPIPWVRQITVLTQGASGTVGSVPISYEDEYTNVPMACERITQSVVIPRKSRAAAEAIAARKVNGLHKFDGRHCRFDGGDFRMRGTRWLEAVYTWTWERGISSAMFYAIPSKTVNKNGDTVSSTGIYPSGITNPDFPLPSGSDGTWIVPPYHTVDLMYSNAIIGTTPREPLWLYRCPCYFDDNGWSELVGASKFEWSTP